MRRCASYGVAWVLLPVEVGVLSAEGERERVSGFDGFWRLASLRDGLELVLQYCKGRVEIGYHCCQCRRRPPVVEDDAGRSVLVGGGIRHFKRSSVFLCGKGGFVGADDLASAAYLRGGMAVGEDTCFLQDKFVEVEDVEVFLGHGDNGVCVAAGRNSLRVKQENNKHHGLELLSSGQLCCSFKSAVNIIVCLYSWQPLLMGGVSPPVGRHDAGVSGGCQVPSEVCPWMYSYLAPSKVTTLPTL